MVNNRTSEAPVINVYHDVDKFSQREKASLLILALAVALFFIENFYFGWHAEPKSAAEGMADFLVVVLFLLSFPLEAV